MKLWLLRPREDLKHDPWEPWYDKAFGFVVRAETEQEARTLTEGETGDEGGRASFSVAPNPWLDSTLSTCEELVSEGEARVIIRDFASA